MNQKLNYNILVELGKNLITGLFPYVFLNQPPKKIMVNNEVNSINLNEKASTNIACTKTKKKLLYYYPHKVNNVNCISIDNFFTDKKYNNKIYFKVNCNKFNKNTAKPKLLKNISSRKLKPVNTINYYDKVKKIGVPTDINFFQNKKFNVGSKYYK